MTDTHRPDLPAGAAAGLFAESGLPESAARAAATSDRVGNSHDGHRHTHTDKADACAPAASARTVSEQLAFVLGSVAPLPPVRVELDAARGLVLAEDVLTVTDTPPFHNSAMDGYAVIRADLLGASVRNPITLTVVADLAAGTAENPRLVPGQVARIMTGAPIPDGADAVVPIEDTDQGTELVTIVAAPAVAAHVRRAGEDAHAGDRVLAAGSVLWPARVAAAASAGTSTVLVHPAPRVAVISTGSELVTPGSPTRRGQIPDSNSFLLSAAVAEAGGIPVRIGAVPDDDDVLRALLAELAGTVDVIVLSGGVSVGAYDVVKAVLKPLGTVDFGPVKMQPGKPQGFGHWPADDNVPGPLIFALPGNPVSAYVSFEVFVRPALRRLLGHGTAQPPDPTLEPTGAAIDEPALTDSDTGAASTRTRTSTSTSHAATDQHTPDHPALHRRTVTATVTDGWNSPPGRAQYMPVIVTDHTVIEHDPALMTAEGSTSASAGSIRLEVRPASRGGSGSHLVAGLAQAKGLAIVPEDTIHIRGGDRITVMLTS
ncbi:gephyrin-like molybdotransferase Glp [Cryobacterium luteum]|uniref:molybdopterin molybdotransferase MoeA n=1 Tax=Cryobacterium luteum TaxID=1424661 RepID=UPI0008B9C87E|nr:gephyrin-like molybdotransferase Glp [Cryobacterium luteum]SEM66400.1 molybdopterin molybdotransferase [Cryobacterium luteum]